MQDIAEEVASKKTISYTHPTRTVNAVYTHDGEAPSTGVYTPNGSIYIGSYESSKWKSDSVRPHWKEILEARGKSLRKVPKKHVRAVKRKLTKLRQLNKMIQIAVAKVEKISAERWNLGNYGKEHEPFNAGDSFGGRKSRSA